MRLEAWGELLEGGFQSTVSAPASPSLPPEGPSILCFNDPPSVSDAG